MKRYGIWCRVEGGVTGRREAWAKDSDGQLYRYETIEAAQQEADRFNERMNHESRKARFFYAPREI
jgi:hypothetical protein